jgi:FkbM family methyltransferase
MIRSPLRMLPRDMTVPILWGPLRGTKWIVGSQRHACWLGVYEPHVQRIIVQNLRPGGSFYDVGANVGFYTLLAAFRVGGGRVFAFEPVPENVSYLKRHLQLNGIGNVEVFEMAMSDRAGMASFQQEPTRAMGRLQPGGNLLVAMSSLDLLLQQQTIAPPAFIKMDIEGAEFEALWGAKDCLGKYKPKLLLATHGKEIHRRCCELLENWCFSLQLLGEPSQDRAEILATPTNQAHGGCEV